MTLEDLRAYVKARWDVHTHACPAAAVSRAKVVLELDAILMRINKLIEEAK